MFLHKNTRGYWEAFEMAEGKRRYVKYIGKDPSAFLKEIERGKDLLGKLQEYPDLALTGGQAALSEYRRRKTPKVQVNQEHYQTIVIDPPWPMEKIVREVRPNQFEFDYPTMTIEQIKALPVPALMADSAHVYLWTTQKFLPASFDVLTAWGAKYIFTMVWLKPGGFQPFGLPQYNCEFILFGKKGGLDFLTTKAFSTCFTAPRREHSRKPGSFYDLVRRVSPGPRLDMFSREQHDSFSQWGNEIDKFRI